MYMHIYIYTKMFKISINCFSILLCCVTSSGAGRVAQWLSACSANSGFKSSVPLNSLKGKKCHKQIPLSNINMLFKFSPLQCYLGERIVPRHREVEHSQCGRLQGELWFSDCFFGHDSSAWPGFNETDIRQPLGLLIHERCKVKFFPGVVFGSYLWLQFLGGRGRQIDLLGFEVSVVYMANSRAGRDT